MPPPNPAEKLGKLIIDENPYSPATTPEDPVEVQADLGTWQFKGVPHYIEKAYKIPYTYTDIHGVLIRDYILVGYAGGGAY